jgi:hypothetical protein
LEEQSLLAARLAAQQLSGASSSSVLEATRHLLAVQAQDPRGARLALRVRSSGGRASDVDRALSEERSLVITWVNRGTLHLIAAEDEPLLHRLTTPQLRTGNERRLRQEGVEPAAADRGISVIAKALADTPMTRGQIRTTLDTAGVPTGGQALVHLLFRATLEGLIVRGPVIGGEHAFVLAADWLGKRPTIERERGLAELTRRYLLGHGPAEDRDLARWAQLSLRDARAGLRAIAAELHGSPDGLVDLRRDTRDAALPPPRLLGPFDPLLLGWRSRELVLQGAQGVVTSNGIFRAIALVNGRAAGTWTMPGGRVRLNLWGAPDRGTVAALEDDAKAAETYLSS